MKNIKLKKLLKNFIKEQRNNRPETPTTTDSDISTSTPNVALNQNPSRPEKPGKPQLKKPEKYRDPSGDKLDPDRAEGSEMVYGCGDRRAVNRNPQVIDRKPYHQPDDCCYIHGCGDRSASTFYCNWVQLSLSVPFVNQTDTEACELIVSRGGLSQFECTGCESEDSCNDGQLPEGFINDQSMCMTDNFGGVDIASFFREQIDGCTDDQAVNYNPEANMDDGSCRYVTCNWCPPQEFMISANAWPCYEGNCDSWSPMDNYDFGQPMTWELVYANSGVNVTNSVRGGYWGADLNDLNSQILQSFNIPGDALDECENGCAFAMESNGGIHFQNGSARSYSNDMGWDGTFYPNLDDQPMEWVGCGLHGSTTWNRGMGSPGGYAYEMNQLCLQLGATPNGTPIDQID